MVDKIRGSIFNDNNMFTVMDNRRSKLMRVHPMFFDLVRNKQIELRKSKNVLLNDPQITSIFAQEIKQIEALRNKKHKTDKPDFINTNIF